MSRHGSSPDECDTSQHGSSPDESVTGLEVVGLHCMYKKNWKLRVGDFWDFSGRNLRVVVGYFIALSSIVRWRENTRTCHVRAYKQGECQ